MKGINAMEMAGILADRRNPIISLPNFIQPLYCGEEKLFSGSPIITFVYIIDKNN